MPSAEFDNTGRYERMTPASSSRLIRACAVPRAIPSRLAHSRTPTRGASIITRSISSSAFFTATAHTPVDSVHTSPGPDERHVPKPDPAVTRDLNTVLEGSGFPWADLGSSRNLVGQLHSSAPLGTQPL